MKLIPSSSPLPLKLSLALTGCLAVCHVHADDELTNSPITASPPSICHGTTAKGRLQYGVQLPASGENFVAYSPLARLAGRTYVHSAVKDIVLSAYAQLAKSTPTKVFKYAETGFEQGGRFKPHKTHQNGLSVDFMTPVINTLGESVHLPTHVFNKWGYNIEFNTQSQFNDLSIDYPALAAHIVALHKAAAQQGYAMWRVIFDPALQPNLLATQHGPYLKTHITFSSKRAWVRHDEHYHVDFIVPCH